jgi:polysaccharide biosynthesis transport protein
VLIGQAPLQDVIQVWGKGGLHVLPSGQIPPNPSELLGSRPMADLLDVLSSRYDIVLIDTPPLLPVTDAAILAKLTGGALVVVGADRLHRQQLADALGSLETVGARVLGVVLNRLARKQSDAYSYYDYASASGTATKRKRKSVATSDPTKQRPAPTRTHRS